MALLGPYERINMKVKSNKLNKLSTNAYAVWVSNYYRNKEENKDKEIRTILIGNTFHLYSVEFVNGEFKTELLHYFNKEYGKKPELAKDADSFLKYKEIEKPYFKENSSVSIETFLEENEELIDAVSFQIHEEDERFWDSPIWD
tara:strand:- start:658 stop:1089 length:432 start_codon:yes stop_codon:yes gene_type:complete